MIDRYLIVKQMSYIRITRKFTFEAAHYLHRYNGLCSNIHGHSYKLYVTIGGQMLNKPGAPYDGMVLDFGILKQIVGELVVDPFDHSFVAPDNEEGNQITSPMSFMKVVKVPFQPTCENFVTLFARLILDQLPQELDLIKVKLYETENAYAEWCREDNI